MSSLSFDAIVDASHELRLKLPESVPAGPVKVLVTPAPVSEAAEDDWQYVVAAGWADELADPREDIYTLDDGEPIREA